MLGPRQADIAGGGIQKLLHVRADDGLGHAMARAVIRGENKIGAAEVRQVFPLAKGFVAGCMVTEGRIARAGHARILRKDAPLFTGRVDTLKRFKDDASEVRAGFECGIRLDGFDDYQPGDVIECFEILQIKPSL